MIKRNDCVCFTVDKALQVINRKRLPWTNSNTFVTKIGSATKEKMTTLDK